MKIKYVLLFSALTLLGCSSSDGDSAPDETPEVNIPTLSTGQITQITANSAVGNVNISSDGGGTLLRKGLCWDIEPNPTIADSRTEESTNESNFSSSITNLSPGTQYYDRAYATNSAGVGYGSEQSFTTLDQ
ncbi:MAG: hypothetical protein AAFU57_12335 [Bacteroidota bacterium]